MDETQAKKLREAFPPEVVGKLPKPTRADNPKGKCQECGGWHGLPAVHLDYVGHAAVTDRLLQVDPEWTWRPMARDDHGVPVVSNGGLWIELTVAGVTRPGWGDGKNVKEMIGDAIRNAAMRFGVALDLWAKEDLHAGEQAERATSAGGSSQEPRAVGGPGRSGRTTASEPDSPSAVARSASSSSSGAADRPTNGGAAGAGSSPATAPDPGGHRAALKLAIVNAAQAHGHDADQVADRLLRSYNAKSLNDLTGVQLIEAKRKLETWERHAEGTAA